MTNQLHAYSVFISTGGDESLRELQNVCIQSTWDAGHSARALISPTARLGAQEEIRDADIVVRLCRSLEESVRSERFWAQDGQKPFLLLVLDPMADMTDYEALLSGAPNGSSVRRVADDGYPFAKDYIVGLSQTVRALDAAAVGRSWPEQSLDQCMRNPFWRRFTTRVNQWATLDTRFNTNVALKQAGAEFFLDLYFDILTRARLSRLFFESGSSIAYVSEAFAARLEQASKRTDLAIETNNILTYMELVLSQYSPVTLYPRGTPEHKYGGTFGEEIMALSVPNAPALKISPAPRIDGRARELMDELRYHFAEQYTDLGIILAATSGIDLSGPADRCGPHVGSYHNMLFKRAMIESGAPVVIFTDEDKLPRPFVSGRCFYVCDEEFTWPYACHNVPLALVCAFRSEDRANRIIPQLEALGLTNRESSRGGEAPWPVILSNDRFHEKKTAWLQDVTLEELRTSAESSLVRRFEDKRD